MAALPSRDKVNFRLPWTNSCISAKLSRSKLHVNSHSPAGCPFSPGSCSGSPRIGNNFAFQAHPALDNSDRAWRVEVWFCNGLNGIHNMQEMSKQRHPCSLCVLLAFLGATPIFGTQRSPSESPQVGTKSELHIVIIQGDNAINNIKQCTAREVIVRVEDENKRPVGGASVAFSLPARGPSGVFAQGNRFLTVITDQNGRAATSALKLNHAVGAFKINVTASFQGHVGTAIVTQTNALASAGATASSAGGAAGGSGGGAAGGGAAGGAAAGGAA